MGETVEFKPHISSPADLERQFFEAMNSLLVEYQDRGMTACHQYGCLEVIALQMCTDE